VAEDPTPKADEPTKDPISPAIRPEGGLKVVKGRAKGGQRPLSIEPKTLPSAKEETRLFYWCGVTPDCPRNVVHAGGFDFPAFVQKQEEREGSEGTETMLSPTKYAGTIHSMTEDAMKRCLEGIGNRIVRNAGPHRDVKMISGSRRPFFSMPGDVPLARYVYMIEVEEPDIVRPYPPKNAPTLLRE